ncbi:cytochrome P450 [Oricola cellulosilytica]|uniref:Cytochrome P450 n=1 Tax=Oricola cellulosilytica TaxID=1429082 RepID=A0A4R0PHS1_9HYPH|nr:cytochrome P450 [Oricola cellulosilytica]TCD16120.1 cytochrome P450 [Oricola cellulosilytica]
MDTQPQSFVPPHPTPRTHIPTRLEVIRTVMRNPLELWGEPSYTLPYITAKFLNETTLICNHPELIRHVLVDNNRNYRMARVRQLILRPILQDGLLTAEGDTWKRSRKAMAPVFTPRHIQGFADMMKARVATFLERYREGAGQIHDVGHDMTELTYEVLATTLFSDEIASDGHDFADDVDKLLSTMGKVSPLDLLKAPEWLPRFQRIRGRTVLRKFRKVVRDTMSARRERMDTDPDSVPNDFLKLLLDAEGPDGLTADEVEDNLITFIGAGHETTARALGWTLYLLANAPHERALVEDEIEAVLADDPPAVEWLDKMPKTRAAFEEAMRLYPPAPSINREAIEDETFTFKDGSKAEIRKGTTVLVMPWVLHRHRLYWENPNAFQPSRFWPEHRGEIDRFQYLPFGAGPRICIGATFALQEAVIALALLLKQFRFEPTPGLAPWPVQKLTVQAQNGLPMRVMKR